MSGRAIRADPHLVHIGGVGCVAMPATVGRTELGENLVSSQMRLEDRPGRGCGPRRRALSLALLLSRVVVVVALNSPASVSAHTPRPSIGSAFTSLVVAMGPVFAADHRDFAGVGLAWI